MDVAELLHDGERLIQEFFPAISVSALHVYFTALPFTPFGTEIYKTYHQQMEGAVMLKGTLMTNWSACVQVIEGHSETIRSTSFSPDGTRIVSGSYDKTVRVWDAVTGGHLQTLEGHSDWITSVSFSPDGTRIVSGSHDNTVREWDAVTGGLLQTLEGRSAEVTSVSFSRDATRIVSASDDKTVRVWDAVTGGHLQTLEGHSEWITSVSFSPDGTRIVSGSSDCTVSMWDAVTGGHLQTLEGHSAWITSVSFSPDGTRIVSGSHDRTVRVWDAGTGMLHTIHNDSNHGQSWPYIINNGWLCNAFTAHKLCWIPVAYRRIYASTIHQVAAITAQDSFVLLQCTALYSYLNGL